MNSKSYCPFCGQKIPVHSAQCSYCGKWLDKSKAETSWLIIALGYIFSIVFALIGLIIAIYLLTRDSSRAKHME